MPSTAGYHEARSPGAGTTDTGRDVADREARETTGEPRSPGGQVESSLLDARRFLDLTAQLRDLYDRVDAAKASAEQKGRWHRRLIAITNSARDDMDRAEGQLVRFTAELDRHLRR